MRPFTIGDFEKDDFEKALREYNALVTVKLYGSKDEFDAAITMFHNSLLVRRTGYFWTGKRWSK
jgi:hypothetical protein